MTKQAPRLVTCDLCRYLYVHGLPGERQRHQAYHAKYVRPRRPKPELRLAAYAGDVMVDYSSPRWLHRLVYDRALALQRDQGYDFPQWDKDRPPRLRDNESELHALLLVEDGTIPVGAVAFSWIDWGDRSIPNGWRMWFAWVAEGWRRKGVMSRRWDRWRSTYGEFTLERPLSDAMEAFVLSRQAEADVQRIAVGAVLRLLKRNS